MPSVKRRASNILNEYGEAQAELIGKAVVPTDGQARCETLKPSTSVCKALPQIGLPSLTQRKAPAAGRDAVKTASAITRVVSSARRIQTGSPAFGEREPGTRQ
jgi:hypothetical protein